MSKEELQKRREHHRRLPADEQLGPQPGHLGQHQRARYGDAMLITPSRRALRASCEPDDIAAMPLEGEYGAWAGPLNGPPPNGASISTSCARAPTSAPSSTPTRIYATVLGIARKEIPACHYMIAAAGGPTIRCSAYATYGTTELSDAALTALEGRTCCLLANHGMIATGAEPRQGACGSRSSSRPSPSSTTSPCASAARCCCATPRSPTCRSGFKSYGPRPKARPGQRERGEARRRRQKA